MRNLCRRLVELLRDLRKPPLSRTQAWLAIRRKIAKEQDA